MGQTSSANIEHLPAPSEPVKPRGPPKRPLSPPQPKTPNYVVAQNKVLPGNIPLDGRSNLRPVSQELVKFMPEIADVYHLDEGVPMDYDADKENQNDRPPLKQPLEGPVVTPNKDISIHKITNDTSTPIQVHSYPENNDSGIFDDSTGSPNPRPTNSLSHLKHTNFDRSGRVKGHRRQSSKCTSLLNEQSTIPEDPREHLYNEWRKDPYTNALPTGTSLPIKSNFEMDESFNLTYAQLAEARRKKTLEELEIRTGKKIQDLTDDLADQSTLIPSPFDRYSSKASSRAPPVLSRSNSMSTASSSDTGVSKRKKKRAPPPPNQNGVVEPPADYDLDLSTHSLPPQTKRQLSVDSSSSNVSSVNSVPTAPPPPINARRKGPAPIAGGITPRKSSSVSSGVTSPSVSRSSSFKSPPVMPKPERQLSELEKRLQSVRDMVEEKINRGAEEAHIDSETNKEDQKDETTSMSTDTVSSMSDNLSLYSIESRTKSETGSVQMEEPKQKINEKKSGFVTKVLTTSNETEQFSEKVKIESKPEQTLPHSNHKKLSTLLQHDIVTAAQARGAKIVKQTIPIIAKPKDQQTVFKEQLGNALGKREDRMKHSKSIDEMLSKTKYPMTNGVVIKSSNEQSTSIASKAQSPILTNKSKSTGHLVDAQQSKEKESSNYSEEWTPEHDLESDEDMNDVFHSHQRTKSEGFKSQIIPSNVKDLKTGSLHKGTKARIYKQSESLDDKNKFGSVRKLKKTVHKGVKNAFGSISRASGKILRRQRDKVDDQVNESSNWKLSSISLNQTFPPANGVHQSESEDSDSDSGGMGVEDIRFDLPDTPSAHETDVKQMKRAGVAYVSGHGQLVVLPDYSAGATKDDDVDDGGRAPKLYRKKKKKMSFESTVRKQERQQWEEQIAEQIRTKELEIERERTRQMEMELEYRRLRDLDSQEKLQRLQTEQMQQHLNSLHRQQRLSAPIVQPPNLHNFNQSYNTSGLPQSPPIMNLNPNNSQLINNVPHNFTSSDVNQLSEYMKMMGVPPPSTPQQWANLLTSVSFTTVPSPLQHSQSMYLPTSAPDLSQIFTKPSVEPQLFNKQSMIHVSGQQPVLGKDISVNGQMSLQKRRMIDLLSNGNPHQLDVDNASIDNLLTDFHNGNSIVNSQSKDTKLDNLKQRSNPVYYSSDEDVDDQLSPAKTNQVLSNVHDGPQINIKVPGIVAPSTGQIVYDSVGYKTVIFNPASPQQSPKDMDDSSSGADR